MKFWIVTVSAFCLAAASASVMAIEPDSLDQQLLEGLDRDLGPAPARGAEPGAKAISPDRAKDASEPAPEHPLAKIATQMRAIERRLAEGQLSEETEREQEEVLRQLAALLKQAGQQGSGGQGQPSSRGGAGSGSQSAGTGGQPATGAPQDSTDRIERGTPEDAKAANVQDVVSRIWGHLPDKTRDQMRSTLSEQFLPKYEQLIEAYYRKLAELPPGGP